MHSVSGEHSDDSQCLLCGKPLTRPATGGRLPKYCSAAHRAQHNRQKRRDEAIVAARDTQDIGDLAQLLGDADPDPQKLVDAFSATLTRLRRVGDVIGTQLLTYEPEEVAARLSEADSRLGSSQSRIRQLEAALRDAQEEVEARSNEVHAMTVRAEDAEDQLLDEAEKIQELQGKLQEQVALIAEHNRTITELRTAAVTRDKEHQELVVRAADLQTRAEQAETALEKFRAQAASELAAAVSEVNSRADRDRAALIAQHTSELAAQENRATDRLTEVREETAQRIAELRQDHQTRLGEQQQIGEQLLSTERDLRAQITQERDRLRRDVDRLTEALAAASAVPQESGKSSK